MKILANYRNGNYVVTLYEDGTKIKYSDQDEFVASFPDSMDVKITNYCDLSCPMCHEESSINGKHGSLNQEFLNSLPSGIELAIGGGNPLSHSELIPFLKKMKRKGIICNLTINEKHFLGGVELVDYLVASKLVRGLGISLNVFDKATLEFAKKRSNVVFHLILGIVTLDKLKEIGNQNFKILLLGYKRFGRGVNFYHQEIEDKITEVKDNFDKVVSLFEVISLDNLGIEQLDIKNKYGKEEFEAFYMGDDGEASMYIDLVENQFALSSTSKTRYPLQSDLKEMFKQITPKNPSNL